MSQLFKLKLDKADLYNFLNKITSESNDNFIINNVIYKKAVFHNYINEYYDIIRPCYYESKRYYVDKKITYRSFITVIRQICRYLCIPFTSKINYMKSTYEISYYVPKDENNLLNS
jgi:hypothetical protein